MIDLDSLRRAIKAAPVEGKALLPISRNMLEEIEQELTLGRAARAQLATQAAMAGAVASLTSGRPIA